MTAPPRITLVPPAFYSTLETMAELDRQALRLATASRNSFARCRWLLERLGGNVAAAEALIRAEDVFGEPLTFLLLPDADATVQIERERLGRLAFALESARYREQIGAHIDSHQQLAGLSDTIAKLMREKAQEAACMPQAMNRKARRAAAAKARRAR